MIIKKYTMKAQELRIGNYVEWSTPALAINIKELSHKVSSKDLVNLEENKILLEPIPLTEEWLLKFGFKKWGRDDMPRTISYNLNDLFSIFPSNAFCDFVGYGFIWYKPDRDKSIESARFKFKYVHQLQNLYFVLTGEELQSKD